MSSVYFRICADCLLISRMWRKSEGRYLAINRRLIRNQQKQFNKITAEFFNHISCKRYKKDKNTNVPTWCTHTTHFSVESNYFEGHASFREPNNAISTTNVSYDGKDTSTKKEPMEGDMFLQLQAKACFGLDVSILYFNISRKNASEPFIFFVIQLQRTVLQQIMICTHSINVQLIIYAF